MSYYGDIRKASIDLNNWLINSENRPSWSHFCRQMRMKYGFGHRQMIKILEQDYPMLTIQDDQPVQKETGD